MKVKQYGLVISKIRPNSREIVFSKMFAGRSWLPQIAPRLSGCSDCHAAPKPPQDEERINKPHSVQCVVAGRARAISARFDFDGTCSCELSDSEPFAEAKRSRSYQINLAKCVRKWPKRNARDELQGICRRRYPQCEHIPVRSASIGLFFRIGHSNLPLRPTRVPAGWHRSPSRRCPDDP